MLLFPPISQLNFSLTVPFSLSFRIHAWAPSRLRKRLLKIACCSKGEKWSRTSPISWIAKRQPSWLPTHSSIQVIPEFTWQKANQQLPKTRSEMVFILACFFLPAGEKWLSDFYLALKITNLVGPEGKKKKKLLCYVLHREIFPGCFKEWIMGWGPWETTVSATGVVWWGPEFAENRWFCGENKAGLTSSCPNFSFFRLLFV